MQKEAPFQMPESRSSTALSPNPEKNPEVLNTTQRREGMVGERKFCTY
jgi:hypothetical protein